MQNLAVVCPGQGSQSVGMLSKLAQVSADIRHTFEEASDAVSVDLWKLVCEGPVETLNLTYNTQPVLVAASVAVWRYMQQRQSFKPNYFAGHSLGEFSALVLAGSLTLVDAVKVVRERGRLMSEALEPGVGGMLAVLGLEEEVLRDLCQQASQASLHVSLANINAPGQIVIAGHKQALEQVAAASKEVGAKRTVVLPVSGPFHSPLIASAAEGLQTVLAEIELKEPSAPIVQNVTNQPERKPDRIRAHLVRQVSYPVNWVGAVQAMRSLGVDALVEVGPGSVLTGLNKRIDRTLRVTSTDTPDSVDSFLSEQA